VRLEHDRVPTLGDLLHAIVPLDPDSRVQ
jgi:hypothetical protein